MTTTEAMHLVRLEGRRVSVALRDGDRIDDSQLVSAGREANRMLWLFANGDDRFVAVDDVVDCWEVLPAPGARFT